MLYSAFQEFNSIVGNIIPKRHISGTEMLLYRSKEVSEIHRGGYAKKNYAWEKIFKHMSGSQLIPDIQTPVMKLWKRFSSEV